MENGSVGGEKPNPLGGDAPWIRGHVVIVVVQGGVTEAARHRRGRGGGKWERRFSLERLTERERGARRGGKGRGRASLKAVGGQWSRWQALKTAQSSEAMGTVHPVGAGRRAWQRGEGSGKGEKGHTSLAQGGTALCLGGRCEAARLGVSDGAELRAHPVSSTGACWWQGALGSGLGREGQRKGRLGQGKGHGEWAEPRRKGRRKWARPRRIFWKFKSFGDFEIKLNFELRDLK